MRENHRAIIEALARYAPLPSSRIALTFGWNAVHVGARDATLSEDDIASLAIEELLAKDRYGRTPLYRATEMGHLHIVEAIVHKTGISTEEALELATLSEEDGSNIELVHFFVSKLSPGCLLSDPSQQVPAQHLLTKMIKRNDVRAVAALCDAAVDLTGCRDFSASDPYSETALCVAINAGAVDVAIMLIDRGADISAIDHKGESMLYLASEKLLAPVVEKLLQHGADPNQGASQGHSPLRATMERLRWWDWTGVFPVARHLLDHGALLLSPTPFENCPAWIAIFYASHFGGPDYERFPMIKELLEKYGFGMLTDPPEKDKPSDNRFQPIHRAVASGDVAKLRDILDTGVPADWPTFSWSEKKTPLEMAVELKDFEAAKLLIDYGADVTSIVDPESDAGGRGDLGAKRNDERRELVQRLLEASQVF
jgi:ankyrin repeat protein